MELQEPGQALESAQVQFDRWGARRLVDSDDGRVPLSILRIICNEDDYVAYRTLMGVRSGVGPGTTNAVAEAAIGANLNFKSLFFTRLPDDVFSTRAAKAIQGVADVVADVADWSPDDTLAQREAEIADLCEQVRGAACRDAWVQAANALPLEMTLEELRDFLSSDNEELKSELLRGVHTRAGRDVIDPPLPDRVRVMTMHGAKGLGARVVFIPGLEDELFPGRKRAPVPGLVLEAARLLYVSMTRAGAACMMSYSSTRFAHGSFSRFAPSRFLTNVGGPFGYRAAGLTPTEAGVIAQDAGLL